MENEKAVVLHLKLSKKHCLFALAFAFLCFHPQPLGSETLTLSTYYPAPYGGYQGLLSVQNTYLASGGAAYKVGIGLPVGTLPGAKMGVSGSVAIGSGYATFIAPGDGAIIQGSVGIGNSAPGYKLDVTGNSNVSSDARVGGLLTVVGNATVGGLPVLTSISCSGGLSCSTSGNTININYNAPPTTQLYQCPNDPSGHNGLCIGGPSDSTCLGQVQTTATCTQYTQDCPPPWLFCYDHPNTISCTPI